MAAMEWGAQGWGAQGWEEADHGCSGERCVGVGEGWSWLQWGVQG